MTVVTGHIVRAHEHFFHDDLQTAERICHEAAVDDRNPQSELETLRTLILLRQRRWNEATTQFEKIEPRFRISLGNVSWACDRGHVYLLMGRLNRARAELEFAAAQPDAGRICHTLLGRVYLLLGEPDLADVAFKKSTRRGSSARSIISDLSSYEVTTADYDRAIEDYSQILPTISRIQTLSSEKASLLVAMGQNETAVRFLKNKTRSSPFKCHARRELANLFETLNHRDRAVSQLCVALNEFPQDPDVCLDLASLLINLHDYKKANHILSSFQANGTKDLRILHKLVVALIKSKQMKLAWENINLIAELQPNAPMTYASIAFHNLAKKNYLDAMKHFKTAIEINPAASDLFEPLGLSLLWLGEMEEAIGWLRKAAEFSPSALATLTGAASFRDDEECFEKMKCLSKNPLVKPHVRAEIDFALVKANDRRGNFDTAFFHARQANAYVSKLLPEPRQPLARIVDQLVSVFTPQFFEEYAGLGSTSDRPIFVCGMPRSGTTLTEQILATHPSVHGAGELILIPEITRKLPEIIGVEGEYPKIMRSLDEKSAKLVAEYYLSRIANINEGDSTRVVDKRPFNFMHLGLIAIIFPNAKIITLERDFRDVALSNYFVDFKFMWEGGGFSRGPPLNYAFDMREIGKTIAEYNRIMRHWRSVLPVSMLRISYENIIDKLEDSTRQLFDFVDLDWIPEALTFHNSGRVVDNPNTWEVRQPVFATSKQKWKRYEQYVDGFEFSSKM